MKTPKGYERVGFSLSDKKSMPKFMEYAGIKNFKMFNAQKMEELYEFFEEGLHSTLIRAWRSSGCGKRGQFRV